MGVKKLRSRLLGLSENFLKKFLTDGVKSDKM